MIRPPPPPRAFQTTQFPNPNPPRCQTLRLEDVLRPSYAVIALGEPVLGFGRVLQSGVGVKAEGYRLRGNVPRDTFGARRSRQASGVVAVRCQRLWLVLVTRHTLIALRVRCLLKCPHVDLGHSRRRPRSLDLVQMAEYRLENFSALIFLDLDEITQHGSSLAPVYRHPIISSTSSHPLLGHSVVPSLTSGREDKMHLRFKVI